MEEIKDLLMELDKNRTPIIINGIDKAGMIKVHKDYIDLKMVWEDEKTTGKGKDKKTEKILKKELIHIPIKDISSISEGEKEIPKTEKEQGIDKSLSEL